jgi:hypothetical protein
VDAISAAQLRHCERQARYAFFLVDLGIGRLMLRARGTDQGSYLRGSVDCRDNSGAVTTCPSGTLAGFTANTLVGIGKASLVLQEENNTNLK